MSKTVFHEFLDEPEIDPNVNCQWCEDKGTFLDDEDQEWPCWCTKQKGEGTCR